MPIATGPINLPGSSRTSPPISSATSSTGKSPSPEQWGNAPFSCGRLANCGFLLTQDTSDYVCIHDVDYMPMWADYSWTSNPARLIWHGLSMRENWETFFGAVSLLDKSVFTAVNGFPNCYWGWGPEDLR